MHTRFATSLAVLGLAFSAAASAQDWMGKDFHSYIGVEGGQSKFRTDCSGFVDCDKKDTGWKVFAGGDWDSILGVEAGYTNFGKVRAGGGDTDAWGANLSLTAGVPIGDRFRVFAKGGAVFARTDVHASASTVFDTGHKNGWGPTYGVGAALGFARNVQARVDWDRYRLDFVGGSRDVDMISAGLQFRF